MAEKKIQENPLPEEQPEPNKPKEMTPKPEDKAPEPVPLPSPPTSRFSIPSFTKTPPNDLYRRLLPAVLFVLTFVTVMTMLLIYMDTVALGAQQFRLNMSRDYELARIPQSSAMLVAYVSQLHIAPPSGKHVPVVTEPTHTVKVLDQLYGEIYNGTFVEVLPSGPRSATASYLEEGRGWRGVSARAHARDFLALRARTRALAAHACLSTTPHPREVSYSEPEGGVFRSRVLCLPLYTVLLAARCTRAQYVLLAAPPALPALKHIPYQEVQLNVIEVLMTDPVYRNKTTEFLNTKNYTAVSETPESIIYALKEE